MVTKIQGKVVVILDASNAVGEAIARHLSEAGASLMLGGCNLASIQDLAVELAWDGGHVRTCEADMADRTQVAGLVAAACDAFGGIDVMVNNPVLPAAVLYEEAECRAADLVAGIHALGAIHGAAAALAAMRHRRAGHIVTVGPSAIRAEQADRIVEEAIWRTLCCLSRGLRSQVERHGIRTTFVAPRLVPAAAPPVGAGWTAEHSVAPAVHAAAVARAVAFAIGQPDGIDVDEIRLRQPAIAS